MKARDRVANALNHKETDRSPIDLGSTGFTGIHATTLSLLRDALKLPKRRVKVWEPYGVLGLVEDDVLNALDIDVVGVTLPYTVFGYKNIKYKEWNYYSDCPLLVPIDFNVEINYDGSIYQYPLGDSSVSPSAKMPPGGYYFDHIIRQSGSWEQHTTAEEWIKGMYSILSKDEVKWIDSEVNRIYKNSDRAIVLNFMQAGFGDWAFVPGPAVKYPKGVRKIEDWLIAHHTYPNFIKRVFDLQSKLCIENLSRLKRILDERIAIIAMGGTDFGSQQGLLISAEMFREFYKPYFKRVNDWIHAHTPCKTLYHSDGSIEPILGDFIECGIDIINPVQWTAEGMGRDKLKRKYGDHLVFWGGGVDTQKTLSFGTIEEVADEVLECLRVLGRGGGYIFNPIHNIQPKTPVKNILRMFEVVKFKS